TVIKLPSLFLRLKKRSHSRLKVRSRGVCRSHLSGVAPLCDLAGVASPSAYLVTSTRQRGNSW
ncbi:hypothetical protein, partial [Microcoleus anatoxicus]|uniref:hypothetical protein n=1 Tax=Microcoleus anatoxicus TaxID=2705319 RepID=UPI0030C9089D